jgi:nucleoside-diphosphate-sugar epimerase
MKILLTGASGFIGSVVFKRLVEKYGAQNIITLPYTEYDRFNNPEIETLIHIGAFIPKTSAQADNIELCNSNIINTQTLLQASFPNLKKVIFASTVDVYGEADIIKEDSLLKPVSLYGLSKLYCEKMIEIFAKQKNIICQTLRIGHVFGPGEEKYVKILPLTIKKIINNEQIEIWGDGKAIRTFIHVDDVASAIVKAINLSEYKGAINVVGHEQITIEDLVKKLISISGKNIAIKHIPTNVPNRNLVFDNAKLKVLLAGSLIPLDNGLEQEYNYMAAL